MKKRGFLLAIEGPDGCGKSHATKIVAELLRGHFNKEVVVTREVGGTPISEDIRKIAFNKQNDATMDKLTRLLLVLAARNQHYKEVIQPAINSGKIVVTDRYNVSTAVLQGRLDHLYSALGELDKTNCLAHITKPADAHILLLGDPKVIYERGSNRKDLDNATYKSGLESTEKITQAYKEIFNFDNVNVFGKSFRSSRLGNSINIAINVDDFDDYNERLKQALYEIIFNIENKY